MPDDSEQDLLEQCLSADPSVRERGFEALYRRHVDRAYRLAFRLTGQDAEARDVTQEAFLRAFRRMGRFRGEAAFSSWLHRITVNIAIDRHRRARRRPAVALEDDGSATRPLPGRPSPSTPGDRAQQRELRDRIRDLVTTLSPPLAQVVVLRYGEGLPYADVAGILGIPVGTVKSRLNRAHDLLAPHLERLRG